MDLSALPFDARLELYRDQAAQLLQAFRSGDAGALHTVRHNHPLFLDDKVRWLPKRLTDEEALAAPLGVADAELALARAYDFADWAALESYVAAVRGGDPGVQRFESAVEAVVAGDVSALVELLREYPELIAARSRRVTKFDPPEHRATLLHYLGANGVEGYRQKSPANAVQVARLLLQSGAAPDALARMYGGECAVMSMLVSSAPPAEAGTQIPLIDVLVDFGASVEPVGSGNWTSPLMTALLFGFVDAAEALVRRGAKVATLSTAAGLGRVDDARRLLPAAEAEERHRALAIAAPLGRTEIIRMLLDAGEDPNRYNPEGMHAHTMPLHQAALAGHFDVVRLLVARGARLDFRDKLWDGTPLGWALHGGQTEIADFLRRVETDGGVARP